jgi:hypothetical protein
VAATLIFDEQVSAIGVRITVTVKPQLVVVPQMSLAVHVTGVVPIRNLLPLGGLQETEGGLHPPVAEEL